jgi:hypothetical protein
LPWDERYLTRWFGFVDQLAARYRHHSALSYISATGPNSHNGEVSLPREPGDLRAWELLGSASTIEANLLGAWQKTIDHFCRAFEGKHFTLAIISKSLPLRVDMRAQRDYAAALASYGARACPRVFGLQSNGLDGRPLDVDAEPLPQWELVASYAGKILTGFQTRAPRNLFCKKTEPHCRGTKPEIFAQMLQNGLSRNVSFLELYEVDVGDASLAPMLLKAHARLAERAR